MNLGEKIYQLRKEKGLSQEALAERLGTTRQAVSKWENSQGFPETEKLLHLSNLFGVSVDFLLKEEKTKRESEEKGYYVSREFAREYLANSGKINRYIGLFYMSLALAGIPCVILRDTPGKMLGAALCIVAGILFLVLGMFSEEDKYKVLKQQPLIFDYDVLKELSAEYTAVKKKCKIIAAPSLFLFILCMIAIGFTESRRLPWSACHSLLFLALATGLLGFTISLGAMEAYELLVKNDQYAARPLFKLKKKIREQFQKM